MSDQDIEQLLAWYANGTLSAEEQAEVEQYLEQHPEARLQLAEYQFMAETLAEVAEDEPQLQPGGFDDLMAQIDQLEPEGQHSAETMPPAATAEREPRRIRQPSLMEKLQQWFNETLQWNLTPAFARVAVVAQFALVAVLGSALFMQDPAGEEYEVLSGDSAVPMEGMQIDIAMQPDTTLADFSQLLQSVQATVISGPNSLGVYRIRLTSDAQLAGRIEQLRQHSGVGYLQPLSSAQPEATQ